MYRKRPKHIFHTAVPKANDAGKTTAPALIFSTNAEQRIGTCYTKMLSVRVKLSDTCTDRESCPYPHEGRFAASFCFRFQDRCRRALILDHSEQRSVTRMLGNKGVLVGKCIDRARWSHTALAYHGSCRPFSAMGKTTAHRCSFPLFTIAAMHSSIALRLVS